MKEILKVEGMSCQNCVKAIETNVGELAGIFTIQVNLDEKNVSVEFDEATISLNQIKEAIEDQGFDVVS